MSGANLIAPDVSTLVETVMMAARAAILPAGVSTLTSRLLQTIRLAGVDSATGACSPSLAIRVPRPWRQAIAALRSCARALSIAESSFRSLPAKLAPSTNSAAPAQSPRSFGSDRGAGRVELAARGLVDGAVGAHQRRQKLLGLARARIAAADAHLLAGRRRQNVEPGAARQPDHRIGVGIVHPARAAIERHVEGGAVGDAAAADLAMPPPPPRPCGWPP